MNVAAKIARDGTIPLAGRIVGYDWAAVGADLDAFGCAVLPKLLTPDACQSVVSLYPRESHFRSHIHMARHGFGKGEYRYFKYPLPALLSTCEPRSMRRSAVRQCVERAHERRSVIRRRMPTI